MKVGDLVKRKYFGHYQKARMMNFDKDYNPNDLYHVIEICDDLEAAKILNTKTGKIECIPNSGDYYEVISDTE